MKNTCLIGIWDSISLIKKKIIFIFQLVFLFFFSSFISCLQQLIKVNESHPPQFLETEKPWKSFIKAKTKKKLRGGGKG